MKKTHIAVIASLLAGFAFAAVTLRTIEPQTINDSGPAAGGYFDQSAVTEERIRALEEAVAGERNARQLLEEELLALYDELDALREDGTKDAAPGQPPTAAAVELSRAGFFRQRGRIMDTGEGRANALVEAGFSPDRAAWIVRREDELRLDMMQARFEAQRAGDMQAMFAANNGSESPLRIELGDREYEQYLNAYGRPTTVAVGSVIETSPGQVAGLQAGDQIVRYDGQRVFSYSDVNSLQLQGEAGEAVVMDILRDGTPMQIVLPRGPIGVQASRFRGR